MLRRSLLLVAACLAVAANRPDTPAGKADQKEIDPEIGDLSGYYTCKGVELGGKSYSGIAVITKKNDVYVIQWVVGGGSNFVGIAVRQGSTFAASWSLPSDKGGILRGVNVYKIEPGPRLVGRWATLPGHGHLQNETLTFLKHLDDPDEE